MQPRILLVEDDERISTPLSRALTIEGYSVTIAATGEQAVLEHAAIAPNLVVLDLGLPDIDGLDVCRRIREKDSAVPVLILTARGDELDRVVGLDLGADDYVAKPFGLAELMARIRAMLRRSRGVSPLEAQPVSAAVNEPAAMTESAGLRVDTAARRAWVGSAELALTAKEFELLSLLHSEAGNVVSRERIMDEVWDENWFGSTKTLDMTVSRLRQKLATQTDDATVTTVRGVGFRLELGRAGASA